MSLIPVSGIWHLWETGGIGVEFCYDYGVAMLRKFIVQQGKNLLIPNI